MRSPHSPRASRWVARPLLVALLGLALGSGQGHAHAHARPHTGGHENADPPRRETITIVLAGGDTATDAALAATFRHSLGRFVTEVAISRVARIVPADVVEPDAAPPGRLTIWLDLGARKAATLYVTDGRNVFVRRLALARGLDAVALDLLDVVVSGAVESALAGKPLGVPRDEFKRALALPEAPRAEPAREPAATELQPGGDAAPPPATGSPGTGSRLAEAAATPSPPAAPPAAPSPVTRTAPPAASPPAEGGAIALSAAAVYAAGLLATTQGFHGPGVVVAAERGAWRIGAEASGRLPYEAAGEGATVRLTAGAFRLSLARLFALGASLVGSAALGVGADLTRVRTVATDAGVAPAASFWALDPAVRPALGLERRLGRVRLGVIAAVDIDLVAPRYVLATTAPSPAAGSSASRALWTPWRWRPYAALTIGFLL